MTTGRIVRGMTQVCLQPRAILELHDRGVLIVHVHCCFVPGETMAKAAANVATPDRRNCSRRDAQVLEYALTFRVAEISSRFEQDDVNDHR